MVDYLNGQNKNIHLDLNIVARQALEKFNNRFIEMEKILIEKGYEINESLAQTLTVDEWMAIWKEAKIKRYK